MKTSDATRPANCVVLPVTLIGFAIGLLTPLSAEPAGRTLQIRARSDANEGGIEVAVIDRAKLDERFFVDLAGLRLWTDSAEAHQQLRQQIENPASAMGVRNQVAKAIMENGVEPDRIPVKGTEGRTVGTDGMVLLEAGEFTRPGEFWATTG